MNLDAIVGWLALAVVLNTSVTALLAVLIIRSGPLSRRVDASRRGMAAERPARPDRAVGPGPVTWAGGPDPLAGAIEAFLGRSDGLFRAGGAMPGQRPAPGGSPPPAGPVDVPARPPIVAARDRALSDVTWATSQPSRFVASGPHPVEARADQSRADAQEGAIPAGASGPSAPPAARRSASRVSIALSDRGGSDAGADPLTVARLGPVIGGFLRERTRANDSITGLTGGRYSVVLPETSLDGAEAFIQRLIQGCDAWLAAEEPPLRLEFGLVDLPASRAEGGPGPRRASGPERRQAVAPRA